MATLWSKLDRHARYVSLAERLNMLPLAEKCVRACVPERHPRRAEDELQLDALDLPEGRGHACHN